MSKAIATGRFAPSPTGDLHLGSLVAATASYLSVKQQSGRWLLRIDDIDTPRVQAASQARICQQLEAYGFEWDELIIQSKRLSVYQDALSSLEHHQLTYACECSRKQIHQRAGLSDHYDQYCRNKNLLVTEQQSIRIITPNQTWHWNDLIQGAQQFNWQKKTGDFIIKRADRIWAYHLVAAVDDSEFGITEVIRGADLLESTAPQQYIQSCLNRASPSYAHHPIMLDDTTNVKLSKASAAAPIKADESVKNLIKVLTFLGQDPPQTLHRCSLADLWQWAITHWSIQKLSIA